MTRTYLPPDPRRIMAELRARIERLERKQRPDPAGLDDHDGTGTGSTVVNITEGSPTAAADHAIAIGYNATANVGDGGVAVGSEAVVGDAAVAVGPAVFADGLRCVAVGYGATATGDDSAAVSAGATATADHSTAVGNNAEATQTSAIAVGYGSDANGINSIAIGLNASATTSAIAIGQAAEATQSGGIAIGTVSAIHNDSIAIGNSIITTGTQQINLGVARPFLGCANSAPADALLADGQCSIWVDQTANQLTFKVKYSTGVVKSGTVALS